MSRETQEWLDANTLTGFTDTRGNAWHWRAGTDNHFPGAVPVKRVRKLFGWEPVKVPVTYEWAGKTRETDRVLVLRDDTGDLLGAFKSGYEPHGYSEWLLSKVEALLDDSLSIGSAGMLKNGAIAWVQVEVPEAIDIPSVGEKVRPSLTATTSFDGTVATTYKRLFQRIICDNTFDLAMREKSEQVTKVKHTRGSRGKLDLLTSREALGIVFDSAQDIVAEIERLAKVKVPARKWSDFLDVFVPVPMGMDEGRGKTMATNKRDALETLYHSDSRVAPWKGTAWGVLNAVSTYSQHDAIVRNAVRAERNMENAIKGKTAESDAEVIKTLEMVLNNGKVPLRVR